MELIVFTIFALIGAACMLIGMFVCWFRMSNKSLSKRKILAYRIAFGISIILFAAGMMLSVYGMAKINEKAYQQKVIEQQL